MPTYFHFQYVDNLHVRSTSYVMNFFSSPSSPQMSRVIPSLDSPSGSSKRRSWWNFLQTKGGANHILSNLLLHVHLQNPEIYKVEVSQVSPGINYFITGDWLWSYRHV